MMKMGAMVILLLKIKAMARAVVIIWLTMMKMRAMVMCLLNTGAVVIIWLTMIKMRAMVIFG